MSVCRCMCGECIPKVPMCWCLSICCHSGLDVWGWVVSLLKHQGRRWFCCHSTPAERWKKILFQATCLNPAFRWRYEGGTFLFFTFLSFPSLGKLETEINPTFIKLRNSRLTNSAVRPSTFPSPDRQLSSTSSRTWNTEKYNITFSIIILTIYP